MDSQKLSLKVVEEDVDHITVVGEEEDVDHIGVLGEEEETRVRIFSFCIFFLSYLLLALRFSSAGKQGQSFYFSKNILSVKIALKRFNFAK